MNKSLKGRTFASAGKIGSGAFGTVVKVFDEESGEELAGKIFEESDDAYYTAEALREISFMRLFKGLPCIVPFLDVSFELSGVPCLVGIMPLYTRDLGDAIKSGDLGRCRLGVMKDVLTALSYLHGSKPPVIHRDLKPENILLDAANAAFLTDFSLARFLSDGKLLQEGHKEKKKKGRNKNVSSQAREDLSLQGSGIMGTPTYIAPEVFEGALPNCAADLWGAGVIFMELCEGRRLPVERDKAAIRLIRQKREQLSKEKPLPFLILSLLQDSPSARSSAEDLLKRSPFVAEHKVALPNSEAIASSRITQDLSCSPLKFFNDNGVRVTAKSICRACRAIQSEVPQAAVAAQVYASLHNINEAHAVVIASKIYEHDVLPDQQMCQMLDVEERDVNTSTIQLLRKTDGNLLIPFEV